MDELELQHLSDNKFFELFLEATKSTYQEYCKFKADEEGLTSYSEPTYEAALNMFQKRLKDYQYSTGKTQG